MNGDDARDDDNELWNIVKKHSINSNDGEEPIDYAYALFGDTCDLVQEILSPAARRWSIFRIRRQMRMAIDMLIDAERLASMPI